jgi:hypothetical protein
MRVSLDGILQEANVIPLVDDRKEHSVKITMAAIAGQEKAGMPL